MNIKSLSIALLGVASLFASCKKETTEPNNSNEPRRWLKVYNNVILGDDKNTAEGQFFNTRTGAVVKLADAASVRSQLSLLYSVTYGGATYMSAPATLDAADPYNTEDDADAEPIYSAPGAGIASWSAADKNSIMLHLEDMPSSEFDALAGSSWTAFDAAFKKYNDGEADLSFAADAVAPDAGDVYLIQINGSLRCIMQVQTSSFSQADGFVKFNLIVEGREDMSAAGKALMPAE